MEKSVGSRVDELLERLDSLESSWSDDGIDASLNEPESQFQPNDLSIESASELETENIVQDTAVPTFEKPEEIQTDSLGTQSKVSEEELVPFPDTQSSGTNLENTSNEKFDNRLDELLNRLKNLEAIKQQQENRSQRSSSVDLSVKESPPNLNLKNRVTKNQHLKLHCRKQYLPRIYKRAKKHQIFRNFQNPISLKPINHMVGTF